MGQAQLRALGGVQLPRVGEMRDKWSVWMQYVTTTVMREVLIGFVRDELLVARDRRDVLA
ncbi:hypothetical protein KO481_36205 [Nocardia sp. NEAU-G5]|uniref:Uncharacterized protein n=1 Tax=Nocardia albiluteola TaxID=2842303 RepID=A0ABS6B9Y2_9NOCA|nr:hypothetical protein [Nocardia albiluteola]MBU3066953.1 hypothetical protein [Nocardia albiluteola]